MRTPAKLVAFAIAVALAFGIGFGVGDAAGPFDEKPVPPSPEHGGHGAGEVNR